jgi:hypothetical protein
LQIPLSNDTPVSQKDFYKKFSQLKDIPSLSWMFALFKGYEFKNLNYEDGSHDGQAGKGTKKDFTEDRRLTHAQIARTKH